MIRIKSKGSFKKTTSFLGKISTGHLTSNLDKFGRRGVDALSSATPRSSGLTAESWDYEIKRSRNRVTISWFNTNTNQGSNIAILLQYGHGTGTGGFVQGYDYINPAIRPIFDSIAREIWEQVKRG